MGRDHRRREFHLQTVACMGACSLAPVVVVDDGHLRTHDAGRSLAGLGALELAESETAHEDHHPAGMSTGLAGRRRPPTTRWSRRSRAASRHRAAHWLPAPVTASRLSRSSRATSRSLYGPAAGDRRRALLDRHFGKPTATADWTVEQPGRPQDYTLLRPPGQGGRRNSCGIIDPHLLDDYPHDGPGAAPGLAMTPDEHPGPSGHGSCQGSGAGNPTGTRSGRSIQAADA